MTEAPNIRMVVLYTEDIEESIRFYESLGFPLKFRDGSHFAAFDGGSITLSVATKLDHPIPGTGRVVVGIKTEDPDTAAKTVEEAGGAIVKGPYDDAHERRAVAYDSQENGLVFYKTIQR